MGILSEKFSILMSVYRKEKPEYFDLSLESNLVKQTVRPDEFVLVCDGELTPELDAVIEKYQSMFPEVMKVYRKENGGLGKALNFGLPKCSYSLVARSDSDDICVEDRFEKQIKYMETHPEIGIISSYIDEFVSDYTNPLRIKKLPLDSKKLYNMAKFRNPLNHMAVMMRKECIIEVGSYGEFPNAQDYELWVRALANGVKIANIGEILVHARVGNGMLKRRGSTQYVVSLTALNKYMKEKGMINNFIYARNMIGVRIFVHLPDSVKNWFYNHFFRR